MIVAVAGESGVGKSTISDTLKSLLGDCNALSTDDLHLYERGHPKWKEVTHLNPAANNLALGDRHLAALKAGRRIERKLYNHDTGKFDRRLRIFPKKNLLIEGLHSYFTKFSQENVDVRIYIVTDETLRVHWKLCRDINYRSGRYEEIIKEIDRRKPDALLLEETQLPLADIVVRISLKNTIVNLGVINENIALEYKVELRNENNIDAVNVASMLEDFYDCYADYQKMCGEFGSDLNYCAGPSGNISVKLKNDKLLIKSSGHRIKDSQNFCVIGKNFSRKVSDKRPSMEYPFHFLFDKYTVHLHPLCITSILSSKKSEKVIREIFDFKYEFIKYCPPGRRLFKEISSSIGSANVVFLENHGVIVSGNKLEDTIALVRQIEESAQEFLENRSRENRMTPDDFLFLDNDAEIRYNFQRAIAIQAMSGLSPKFLTKNEKKHLSNMREEKYRTEKHACNNSNGGHGTKIC